MVVAEMCSCQPEHESSTARLVPVTCHAILARFEQSGLGGFSSPLTSGLCPTGSNLTTLHFSARLEPNDRKGNKFSRFPQPWRAKFYVE